MAPLIIVPAFNEEKSIADVIIDLQSHGYKDILVIDDGSTDKTGTKAKKAGASVIRHVLNRGLGAALGTGFEYAKMSKFGALVTFDGDRQHLAKDVKTLLEPIINGQADVVIGTRPIMAKKMPLQRKVANLLANLATYVFFGQWTNDSQSGLRAFNRLAIDKIEIKTDRMEVSSEFFREVNRNSLRYFEIPIRAIYTKYSLESSSQEAFSSVKIPLRLFMRQFRP